MEASGGLGSNVSYDVKLSAGVASVSIIGQIDLAAEIMKFAEKCENATEKMILVGAAGLLKGMS